MTLPEIRYMILEEIRNNMIVDDERIDFRLLDKWIMMKRALFLKNVTTNSTSRINLAHYQTITVTVSVKSNSFLDEYPFDQTNDPDRQLIKTVESTTEIPNIIENRYGPIVYSIESTDKMKLAFSFVDFDYMKVVGNGRFNRNLIFASVRDKILYFKYNTFFDTHTSVILKALFEDPTQVPDFDKEEDEYPCNADLIEYIKNAIFKEDISMIFKGKSDEVNDASGNIE